MKAKNTLPIFWLLKRIRNHFLSGIVVIVPLGLTILILVWLFTSVDNILQPLVVRIFGHTIPGVGFGVIVVVIYLAGLFTSNVLIKKLQLFMENWTVSRIPIVRPLFQGIRQILESFSSSGKNEFLSVVLVEFPRKGMKSIGFVTNEKVSRNGEKLYHVFVPTAPNPVTGFVLILNDEAIEKTNMSVEDAVKMMVSIGKYVPPEESAAIIKDNKGN